MKFGVLLTEFPNQTSISMWRVAKALRDAGNDVAIVSTRRPSSADSCHENLVLESKSVFYSWPPSLGLMLAGLFRAPLAWPAALKYIFSLSESSFKEKLKVLVLLLPAAALAAYTRRESIEHLVVHSCSSAAHLVNLSKILGGARFSLRLGGDLEVYGGDHASKFKAADFIIPASLNNKEQILAQGLKAEEKILTTWLGVDTTVFKPEPMNKDGDTDTVKLLTIARLNVAKGHRYVIELLPSLLAKGFKLEYSIAGAGPEEQKLKQLVDQLQLSDCVKFCGQVNEKEAIELLQSHDIFLLPSVGIGEASPMSLIEAMAAGIPTVSSIIGGTPCIVNHQSDGYLFEQKNTEQLAAILEELIVNPNLREKIGASGRASAERYFGSDQVAAAIQAAVKITQENKQIDLCSLSPIEKKMRESNS